MSPSRCISFLLFILLIQFIIEQTGISQSLFKIRENGLWGYINIKGKVIIEPQFPGAGDFSEGLAPVRSHSYYGFIDTTGKYLIQPQYDYADSFSEGYAIIANNGVFNYIDKTGKKQLALSNYSKISDFKNGRARVEATRQFNKYPRQGIINSWGSLIIDTLYTFILNFADGAAIVESYTYGSKTEYGIIDSSGTFIVPFEKYKNIDNFQNGYAKVSSFDDKFGIINSRGISWENFNFYNEKSDTMKLVYGVSEGLLNVQAIELNHPDSNSVSYGKHHVEYIDLNGNIVIDNPEFLEGKDFQNDRTFVAASGLGWLLIDKTGKRIGSNNYSAVDYDMFQDNICVAGSKQFWGIIDTNGTFIIKPIYNSIIHKAGFGNYFLFSSLVKGKIKWGIGNLIGKVISNPKFDDVDKMGFQNGLLKVIQNERKGYVNTSGKYIWRSEKFNKKLNIDYQLIASCKVNKDSLINNGLTDFPVNTLSLIIKENEKCSFNNIYEGSTIYLANNTDDSVGIPAVDFDLYLIIEALDLDGNWKPIEEKPSSMCGNSYVDKVLKAGHFWKFSIPNYYGGFKTKLRATLKIKENGKENILYSNIINGSINPGQFWRSRTAYWNLDFFDKNEY